MYHKACQHTYDLNRYSRDDMGFYVDCTQCGETLFIPADTENEFYSTFGLDDNDDDFEERENDINYKYRWDEKQDFKLENDPF
jgi:hypothetical protein